LISRACWKAVVSTCCSCRLSCARDGVAGASCSGNDSSSSGCSRLVPDKDDSSRYQGKAITNGESSGSSLMLDPGICTEITRVSVYSTGTSSFAGKAGGIGRLGD
jgi:hypothetical protein